MKEELKCKNPECNKSNIRFRIKSNSYVCNVCGYSWKKEEVKDYEKIQSK